MKKFKTVRHLDYDKLYDFLLLEDSDSKGNQFFNEKFAPFFGSQSSIKLKDNTLCDIATTIVKEDVDHKFKPILDTTGEKRILDLMGLLATYCCWTSFTM